MSGLPNRPLLRRSILRLAAVGAALSLIVTAAAPVAAARPTTSLGHQSTQKLTRIGTAHVAKLKAGAFAIGEIRPDPESAGGVDRQIPNSINAARVPSAHVPRPATIPVADATAGNGFDGLNHFDQRFAGTGAYAGTQFSLEPPDQGLCVGNGFVVETINTAVRVRDATGNDLTAPIALNQFFGLTPEIIRPAGPFGDFTSDPKCYFDTDTGQFFLTLLQIDIVPTTGDFGNRAKQLIAVTKNGDPTGDWNLFSFDTTDDGTNGTPSHPGCPCFGDQPLIGADATGFYVTTNEFPIHVNGFNGAQVYALNKFALASGSLPTVVHIDNLTQAEGPAFSMQPTTTPPGGAHASVNGGTEFFLSSLDFDATLDDRITLWALTNTSSLTSGTPSVALNHVVLGTEVYGQPPAMQQRFGPAPLDEALQGKLGVQLGLVAKPATEHFNVLNSNDDRMNQTVYADGKVWGAVNTVVKSPTGVTRTGIAYFIVAPSWNGTTLAGSIANQGYVAVQNNNVVFPAIAANAAGKGIISFTLVGPSFFPGAAYAKVDASHDASTVFVARFGSGPADGFTGEQSQDPVDNGVERWGDYGAAVAAADGSIWFAAETINQTCTLNQYIADTTCGHTRTLLANWGSFIGQTAP